MNEKATTDLFVRSIAKQFFLKIGDYTNIKENIALIQFKK